MLHEACYNLYDLTPPDKKRLFISLFAVFTPYWGIFTSDAKK